MEFLKLQKDGVDTGYTGTRSTTASLGYQYTGSSDTWRGFPGDAEFDGTYPVREGSGLFMQALQEEIKSRNLPIPPILGVGLDLYGIDLDQIGDELENQLRGISNQ